MSWKAGSRQSASRRHTKRGGPARFGRERLDKRAKIFPVHVAAYAKKIVDGVHRVRGHVQFGVKSRCSCVPATVKSA